MSITSLINAFDLNIENNIQDPWFYLDELLPFFKFSGTCSVYEDKLRNRLGCIVTDDQKRDAKLTTLNMIGKPMKRTLVTTKGILLLTCECKDAESIKKADKLINKIETYQIEESELYNSRKIDLTKITKNKEVELIIDEISIAEKQVVKKNTVISALHEQINKLQSHVTYFENQRVSYENEIANKNIELRTRMIALFHEQKLLH
jgi:hypothetical protein